MVDINPNIFNIYSTSAFICSQRSHFTIQLYKVTCCECSGSFCIPLLLSSVTIWSPFKMSWAVFRSLRFLFNVEKGTWIFLLSKVSFILFYDQHSPKLFWSPCPNVPYSKEAHKGTTQEDFSMLLSSITSVLHF